MRFDTRWLEWRAPEETVGSASQTEGGFGTFGTSLPGQIVNFFPLEAEPTAYEETLGEWVRARCVFSDRAWGGIKAFHRDYAEWCDQVAHDVPAGLATFEKLLREFCSLVTNNGLIYGVLLKEDWESWKTMTQSKKMLQRRK
jgi:hypothetical protein